jgi:GH35 family endo-1,4-beta-xylanase
MWVAEWVSKIDNAAELKSVLEKHVTTEVGRYKGKIYAWDVANEIFDESGNFRASPWNRRDKGINMDEMVKIAFEAARKAVSQTSTRGYFIVQSDRRIVLQRSHPLGLMLE